MRQVRILTLVCVFSFATSLCAEEARRAELVNPPKKSATEEPARALPVTAADKKEVAAAAKREVPSIEIDLAPKKEASQTAKKEASATGKKEISSIAKKEVSQGEKKEVSATDKKEVSATAKKEVVAAAKKEVSPSATREIGLSDKKEASSKAKVEFTFKDQKGKTVSAEVVDQYQSKRIVYPLAKIDHRINAKLVRAASIAQERSRAHSKSACWHYVKNALLASGIISSYPKSVYAKQAGEELVRDYGFKKLPIHDPYQAPIGAVLVYGSRRVAGHVELRTKTGFVSDFQNKKPSKRPLLGVYAKA